MTWLTTEIDDGQGEAGQSRWSGWRMYSREVPLGLVGALALTAARARRRHQQQGRPDQHDGRPGRLIGGGPAQATREPFGRCGGYCSWLIWPRQPWSRPALDAVLLEDRDVGPVVDHGHEDRLHARLQIRVSLFATLMPSRAASTVTPDSSNWSGCWTV